MSTAQVLSAMTFPLHGSRLIEASAGTGKTYTIASLYVRLILGHGLTDAGSDQQLLPADILVVTFTEAATKELRERIRSRLTSAALYFRQQLTDPDDFLIQLRAAYSDHNQWLHCAQTLELAANWMDESAIYTIHGWCNRMLQQHAFDSGSLFNQTVNTNASQLLHQVVRDYWRTHFYPLSASQCPAVLQLASSPDELLTKLKNLLFEPAISQLSAPQNLTELFDAWSFWQQQASLLSSQTRTAWLAENTQLTNLLINASAQFWLNGNSYKKATFAEKLSAINAWAQSEQTSIEFKELYKFSQSKLQNGLVKAHKDKAELFSTPALIAIESLCEHLQQEPELTTALSLHACQWIQARYLAEKQRLATISFDDMLTKLDAALHGPMGDRLTEVIRSQFPVAMIDEFQDTDAIQYRIFARIYPAQTQQHLACFMIGDPKQAIYSFRGADIYTYLKAHQATQPHHYSLDTNYRSTPELVAAVNQLFSYADQQQTKGAFGFKTPDNNPLAFTQVNANKRSEQWYQNGNPVNSPLTLWVWPSDQPIAMSDYRQQLAEVTVSQIVTLLNNAAANGTGFKNLSSGQFKPLKPSDIAILVRSGREAGLIRKALAKRQLASVYLSENDSIFASQEAADVLLWLKAIADPRNETQLRAALASQTMAFSYIELAQFANDETAWEEQLERFIGYQQRWLAAGILPALRRLIIDYGLHQSQQEGQERCLTNLLHIAELLQQASVQLDGELALIRYLAEAIADQDHLHQEESILRLESDADLIQVITIHKSKGLEYPLVFLPFICSFKEASGNYYRYHDVDQNLCIDLEKTTEAQAIADQERLQEDLRLLYVALTRAQYACWLGIAGIKSRSKSCQLNKTAIGHIIGWQDQDPSQLSSQLQAVKADCAAITIENLPSVSEISYQAPEIPAGATSVLSAQTKIADNWWIASYSSLAISGTITHEKLEPEQADEPETAQAHHLGDELEPYLLTDTNLATGLTTIHGLPKGAGPGVLIHSLLETCGRVGFKQCLLPNPLAAELIANYFSQADWQAHQQTLADYLQQWLNMPLLADQLSLAQLDEANYQAEMEFLLGADEINGVEIAKLDQLIIQHTFQAKPRPALVAGNITGLLKGFIDLVFVHQDQYYVVDYKFNSLGENSAAYGHAALEASVLAKRYDLQMLLYLLALHRLLKSRLGADYAVERHIGGALYVFLRGVEHPGHGVFHFKPSQTLLEALDHLFQGV